MNGQKFFADSIDKMIVKNFTSIYLKKNKKCIDRELIFLINQFFNSEELLELLKNFIKNYNVRKVNDHRFECSDSFLDKKASEALSYSFYIINITYLLDRNFLKYDKNGELIPTKKYEKMKNKSVLEILRRKLGL